MRYGVIIEPAAGGFSGYVPDLPGCVAAAGTVDEVRALLTQAVRLHIETLVANDEQVPEPGVVCDYVEASGGG